VKEPADGWDAEEAEALRSLLEESRWNHAGDAELSDHDRFRLLRRIQQERLRIDEAAARAAASRRTLWRVALSAAALVMLAAGGLTMWRRFDDRLAAPVDATRTQVAVATPPSAPAFVLPLDPPQIKVSPSALTFRGPGGENRLLSDLKGPFDALRAGNHAEAARQLAPLAARYPASVEVPYYEGIAQLFLNNPAAALDSLARAERAADPSFAPDVAWYQAIALERAGRRAEARSRLVRLCAQNGTRSAVACAAEQTLK